MITDAQRESIESLLDAILTGRDLPIPGDPGGMTTHEIAFAIEEEYDGRESSGAWARRAICALAITLNVQVNAR